MCLLVLLCACSSCCVPARPAAMPAQPVVCLLSLLCATIQLSLLCATKQLSLLCACSACCVPQYSLLYCDSISNFFFRKWAVAHFSSSNLSHPPTPPPFFFFFSNPPIASLPLLKCSSLDHCNSYNSKKKN